MRRRFLKYRFTLIASILFLTACAPSKFFEAFQPQYKQQEDCGFVQNVYGERISWKGKYPILIQVHESVPQEFYSSITESLETWEKAAGKKMFQVVNWSAKGPLTPRQDGINTIYNLDQWEAEKHTEQARTSVYWVGDQIREFDIRINSKDFRFYSEVPQNGYEVHLPSLFVHEVGHALGLKHKDSGGSVMATYLASNVSRSQIVDTDSHALSCEY